MDYYYESMYPELKFLEDKRLQTIATLKRTAFFMTLFATGLTFFLIKTAILIPLHAVLASFMGGFLIFMFVYRHESAGYSALFKDHVIEKIIHFLDPTLVYRKMEKIAEAEYQKSELFLETYERYSGSDRVSGEIEGVKISFCDLHVEKKERDKNGKEEWHDIFKGLFFYADFNKTFQSKVIVLPDMAERTLGVLGSWMQGLNVQRGKLIKLDHVEFEKLFVVYGEDQIESRYILSPSLMEKIVQFHNKVEKALYLSFIDGKLYMAIPYTKPLFEPILNRSLLDFKMIQSYFELLEMILSVVNEFKLNEKLWSKH